MITKLRKKFILINMLLAVLVLTVAFGVVTYLDYTSSFNSAYHQLEATITEATKPKVAQIESVQPLTMDSPTIVSIENMADGTASTDGAPGEGGGESAASQSASDSARESITSTREILDTTSKDTAQENYPTIGTDGESAADAAAAHSVTATPDKTEEMVTAPSIGTGALSPGVLLIAVYEVQSNGIYTSVPAFSTASIAENVLLRANDVVMESDSDQGDLKDFGLLYVKRPYNDSTIIAYGDDTGTTSWRGLAWSLTGVGMAALAVLFLINIYFSRWALRPVKESIEQQQQFTADASHELKTPLTVILANMAILRSSPKETVGDQIQWVESTQKEAERMQLLVSDMLDLAKLKTVPGAEEDKAKFDFSDLVEGEVLQFESVTFERGIIMESEIEPGLFVYANPVRCERMVSTLIDNACKYVNDGGSIHVDLKAQRGALKVPCAILTVNNTGPVISEEDLPHLFNRFYRADKARTGSKGGYGLGLAIAREIATDANGDITVQSSEAEGTTFTVTIPLSV